jgi:HK97 family phage major capsid protein
VSVSKESGQAAATFNYANVKKMWARMWAPSRQNAVWFINQDVEPQLYSMNEVVGTGGVPVYLPANGAADKPFSTLFGRPVVPIEYAQTLGTVGDVLLADFSQYVAIDKGGIEQAASMHVRFIYDEQTFRFIYRVDGEPMWKSALTPKNGTNTLSPFVTLATRS